MTTKKCEQCEKEFPAQRNDARFCSSSCRSLFWQKNKLHSQDGQKFLQQLKGVVKDNPIPEKKIITKTSLNPEYINLTSTQMLKAELLKRLLTQRQTLIDDIKSLQKIQQGVITLVGGGAGAAFGYSRISDKKNEPSKRLENALKGGLLGLCGGFALELMTKDLRDKQRMEDLRQANVSLKEVNAKITLVQREIETLKTSISKTDKHITVEKEIEERPGLETLNQHEKPVIQAPDKRQINVSKPLTAKSETFITLPKNEKIISSAHLTRMEYEALNFQGKWRNFFGLPSVNFHCAIHGMAGEGKSTFAIQFANYLAENFGVVIYISGEEGFSKTMKDKFINNNAATENLYLADLRTYQDLTNEVKPNIYNFIFIDSLDNMRIGALELKELRKLYINSALITISQSTKEGKMRGSYEIVHDSDIAVAVADGVAETVKNRFLEKGRNFEIFEKEGGGGLSPWNTVRG